MANIKIQLSSDKRINNVNIYSDADVRSDMVSETLYDRNAIRNSLHNILTWKPYERILNPRFGNALWDNVFEMIGRSTKQDIVSQVQKMLAYEPRISVKDIDVSVSPDSNTIEVSFSYSIPSLDSAEEQFTLKITRK